MRVDHVEETTTMIIRMRRRMSMVPMVRRREDGREIRNRQIRRLSVSVQILSRYIFLLLSCIGILCLV